MIESRELQAYLARVFRRPVELLGVRPLKDNRGEGPNPKAFGYGVPLEVECLIGGEPRQFVLARTRPEEGFGHEYPADRAWAALWGHAAFNALPRHVRSLDVGFVRAGGELVSAGDSAGFFQLVEKAEGTPDWLPLGGSRRGGLPGRDPRGEEAGALALPAAGPRARRARRVPHGDPRQLPASIPAVAARGVRGPGACSGRVALAAARVHPPAGAGPRGLPSVEPPLPRGDRFLRGGPEPGRGGGAGRRRGRPQHQPPG